MQTTHPHDKLAANKNRDPGSRNFSNYHTSLGHSDKNRSLSRYGSQPQFKILESAAKEALVPTVKKGINSKPVANSKIFMSTHEKMLVQKRLLKNLENPVAAVISQTMQEPPKVRN
jgi:hypothetical protein